MVTRTELTLGEENFDEAAVRGLWAELCGEANATMRAIAHEDGVHLLLYPFRHYEVHFETGEMDAKQAERFRTEVAWSRKLVLDGVFPSTDDIINNLWVPIRKCADRHSSHYGKRVFGLSRQELKDLRYVACLISSNRSVDQAETPQEYATEISFLVSNTDQEDWSDERVTRTLDNAVTLFGDALRAHIEKQSPSYMDCVWLLDQLSTDFADALVNLEF
ncbi:hypothetical protein IJ102_02095 [Candidatus Saccharibacteria bacterium]|nr:hypothetical protein [Candidatus Saccharibacteria bacterium]